MIGFIAVAGLLALLAFLAGVRWTGPFFRQASSSELFVGLVVLPVLAIATVTLVVGTLRRPAMFEQRARSFVAAPLRGLLAGITGLLALTLLLPLVQDASLHRPLAAGCYAVSALMMILSARRVAQGHCVRCGYDLQGTPTLEPCSECGLPRI